ncbi:MAG TPA: hypothetical protein VL357_07750 [Rariglobus sp.]|jgi:hypothetical protein|nr:hypothetical protein [Rariglobus sp.]
MISSNSMLHRFIPCLAVLIPLSVCAAPAVPLVNLVDDHAAIAISITDVPALLKGWDASPFAKTWNDPQVSKFFAPLREKMKIDEWDAKAKDATGSTVRELLALADGEALFAMPSVDFSAMKDMKTPPLLIAIHVGEQAPKVEKLMADSLVKEKMQDQTETFDGVTVHIIPSKKTDDGDVKARSDDFIWALDDGVWIIGLQKERVFAAIDALKNGGVDAALGKSVHFLSAREHTGDDQALFYMNLATVYPILKDAVAAKKTANNAPNPLGIDPETLLGALGLDALGEIYYAAHFGPKDARMDFGLTYTEERGLLKLMSYQPGPVPQADWIPSKWPVVSISQFSVPQAYAGLEQLLDAISPMLSGMAQGQITALNRKLGIDLKRDLIGSLGNQLVSAYALPSGLDSGQMPPWDQMDQLIAVSLDNVDAFTQAIEALKQMAGGPAADQLFTKRDYLGQTIYTLNTHTQPGAKPVRGFSYAIANRVLLVGVGSSATVENVLQGMRDGQGAFWKRDEIKAALAGMPADAGTIQLTDMRVVISSLLEMAVRMADTAATPNAAGKPKPGPDWKSLIDSSAKPDADVIGRYWGIATGYSVKNASGLFGTTHLSYPQP